MRFAVLSDIHSNVYALAAVLEDCRRRQVETMFNLGDILYGPIAPRATYDLLQEHEFVTVSGNQDRQLHAATEAELAANPTIPFALEDLGAEPVDWLKTLPFDWRLDDELYLCHGAPTDDQVYLLEDVSSGRPVIRPELEIAERLGGTTANIVLCGHSHLPHAVGLATGQLVVNPGSVGLPAYADDDPCRHAMQTFSPHASYVVIEKSATGCCVQHLRAPYDHERAAAEAERHGRDYWAGSMRTGRV